MNRSKQSRSERGWKSSLCRSASLTSQPGAGGQILQIEAVPLVANLVQPGPHSRGDGRFPARGGEQIQMVRNTGSGHPQDAQAAAQHIAFSLDAQRRVGAALLGHDVPVPFI
jgi:hypothetical protein